MRSAWSHSGKKGSLSPGSVVLEVHREGGTTPLEPPFWRKEPREKESLPATPLSPVRASAATPCATYSLLEDSVVSWQLVLGPLTHALTNLLVYVLLGENGAQT